MISNLSTHNAVMLKAMMSNKNRRLNKDNIIALSSATLDWHNHNGTTQIGI
jgi:hypothetical protein